MVSISEQHSNGKKWIFFCEDATQINLPRLLKVLMSYPSHKVCFHFLGFQLKNFISLQPTFFLSLKYGGSLIFDTLFFGLKFL